MVGVTIGWIAAILGICAGAIQLLSGLGEAKSAPQQAAAAAVGAAFAVIPYCFMRAVSEIRREMRYGYSVNPPQCPFCAEVINPAARVCRYCGRDLQESPTSAPADMVEGTPTVSDAASDLKQCPECLELVWSGLKICPACSCDFRWGATSKGLPAESRSFKVVLDHIPPSRQPALRGIVRQLHNAMSDADVDAVLGHPEGVIANALSLQEANTLMLKLHEQGFDPRKQQDA